MTLLVASSSNTDLTLRLLNTDKSIIVVKTFTDQKSGP